MSKRILGALALCALLIVPNQPLLAWQQPATAAPARNAEVLTRTNQLLQEVSQLRHLSVVSPVKSGLKSRKEIEQVVIRNFGESSRPEEIEAANKTLIALGLVPPDFRYKEFMIRLLVEQVAGFYEPKTKEFYLADWTDLDQQKPIMAHELVHALQDQHFNLRRFENWPHGDGDREQAVHALVEGDATALMFDYLLKPQNLDITRLPRSLSELGDLLAVSGDRKGEEVIAAAPAAIRESLLFPYTYGAGFAQEIVKRSGWDGLSKAFEDLPQSTEQIIHVDKYLGHEQPVKIKLTDISSTMGPGWKRIDADVNGEFGYFLILGQFIPKPEARSAAKGWAGDQCSVYENAKGELAVAHLSTWDTAADAEEFLNAYGKRTAKRYAGAVEEHDLPNGWRGFLAPEGEALIELRGNSVLALEGVRGTKRERLVEIMNDLWKSAPAVSGKSGR